MASQLNISKPAITRAADRLGDLNFTAREPDTTDRRSVFVTLTKEGKRFLRGLPAAQVGEVA